MIKKINELIYANFRRLMNTNELYDDNLKKIISYFSNKVILELGCKKLNMVVHHTLVFCFPNIEFL